MQDIKDKIQQLIVQEEGLLYNIPKKLDYKAREQNIRDKYRLNEPLTSIGREIISEDAGELVSNIFGAKKEIGKSLTSKILKNQYLVQLDSEIKQLWKEYDYSCRNYEAKQ